MIIFLKKICQRPIFQIAFPFSTRAQAQPLPTFKAYNLYPALLSALEEMEIHTPSPVQQLTLSEFKKINSLHNNFYIAGQTGTGKTLAYLLPIMDYLKKQEEKEKEIRTVKNRPNVIIIVPSKELVEQTLNICKKLIHFVKLRAGGLYNYHPFSREAKMLDDGVDIVVATIDRLERHRKNKNIFLSNVDYFVIDEADTFLDSGEKDALEEYADLISKRNGKVVYVSATYTSALSNFFDKIYGRESNLLKKLIEKNTHMNLSNLEHEFIHVRDLDKQLPLMKILKEYSKLKEKTNGATMIFCNSIPSCQSLEYKLKSEGLECISLHGDIPKNIRIQNFTRFNSRQANILISTDLGSRGLDFPFLNHVVNFDFPKTTSDYLHRAGRAGRAGRKGYVTSLYHNRDSQTIKELQEAHESGMPVKIGNSAYSLRRKGNEKNSGGVEDNQNRTKFMKEEDRKLLPDSYLKFKEQWEKGKENKKKTKFYLPEKNKEGKELKELKKEEKKMKKLKLYGVGRRGKALKFQIRTKRRAISRKKQEKKEGNKLFKSKKLKK